MTIRILAITFSVILSSCGGGGSSDTTPTSENPPTIVVPELVTGDTPIGVDTSTASVERVSKESALYFSFAAEAGTSYRVTLQPVSQDADFTLLDSQILSDQSIVGFAQSNGSLADVFYDATDDRIMYIEVNTLNDVADFKLYVNRLSTISTKLKIFVTSETHNGSLASDTTLIGSNAIEKADYICSTSAEKPDDREYKALLVDGLYRDAPALKDWVLQPDTTYYRIDGVVPIATTSSDAIFSLASQGGQGSDLVNAVGLTGRQVWTGAADVGNFFTVFFSNCGGWAATTGSKGVFGISTSSDSTALGTTTSDCSSKHSLYCVQQL